MKYQKLTIDNFALVVKCLPKETAKEALRQIREKECYSIINRGILWYNTLTEEQKAELLAWYDEWKDVTETFVKPKRPEWIK